MNVTDVKKDIKDITIKPFYIFAGDEYGVQLLYIYKIAQVLGFSVVRADSLASVWKQMTATSLLVSPSVYVVRDDKDLLQDPELVNRIEAGAIRKNILILLITDIDKRGSFYKTFENKVVHFTHLDPEVLIKYIQVKQPLSDKNCSKLIQLCEADYSRILLELDKLTRYVEVTGEDCNKAFGYLLEQGVFYIPPQDAIFDFVDAVLKRQAERSFLLLEHCVEHGEPSMVLLTVLYTNFRQVLQVITCKGDPVQSTGLTAWVVKCAKERAGYYSGKELVSILRLIQKIQQGIITGQIEDDQVIPYLLVRVL